MQREIKRFKEFSFYLKKDNQLSKREKKQMHDLLVRMYPPFKSLFDKHGYYSSIKPQMNFLIKKDDLLVGTGKFLWRNLKIKNKIIKLFAFGMVVVTEYQNRGLGTNIVRLAIKEAKRRKGSLLYGSTSNLKVKKMLNKLGFQKLKTPIFYKDVTTKKIKKEKGAVFVFEIKKSLVKKLEKLPKIYIGLGQI